VAAHGTVHLAVSGRGGVPLAGVAAVVLNVTVTAPTACGSATVFPQGKTRPTPSHLHFIKGQTVSNLVVVPLGTSGKVALHNGSAGTAQLIADVHGYHRAGTPTGAGGLCRPRPGGYWTPRPGPAHGGGLPPTAPGGNPWMPERPEGWDW
jgi:hypothetical protein